MPTWRPRPAKGAKRIDHRPHLILPGFIDAHVHFPQMQVIASYGTELLDWLNKYTFPEETKFQNAQHGRRIARLFLDEMIRQGTTTVAAYCSVHKQSAEAFFAESHERNMLNIAGKVMMDRNAPEGVLDTPQSGYDDTKALIAEWHGKGRQHYAITPRFAITSSPEQMEMAGALMREFPDLHMQTHLSENHAEIAFTQGALPVVARLHRRLRALRPARQARTVRALHPPVASARRTRCRTAARSRSSARPRTSSSAPACSTTSAIARGKSRCGSPPPPMSAAAPTIRCCAPWTKATR